MTAHTTLTTELSYRDNPNPNAKIGFVVFYPFQYYVFKNVYEHLKDGAEFIVDEGAFFPTKQPPELIGRVVALLKKQGVYFRILPYGEYFHECRLENFFSGYSGLVSLWMYGCLRFHCNLRRRKIHLTYGIGKDLITYGIWKRKFDLILAYGERDQRIFSLYTQSEAVGNPKFDDWFNEKFDTELSEEIRARLDPQKKTMLYLPTHSDLCSIDVIADELKKLTKNYNVIVKFHYYTPPEEPERVQKLKDPRIICLNDDADLITLLKISDVVLSDNSSVIFDVILADKPLIATDFLSDEYLDWKHGEYKPYRRGIAAGLTYSGSIEQKIKKEGLIVTLKRPEELPRAVRGALEDSVFYKASRKKLRKELFSFHDGTCGERAAMAIKNFLATKELPEKPLLWHLIENLGTMKRLTTWLEEKIRETETPKPSESGIFVKKFAEKQVFKTIFFLMVKLEDFLRLKFFVFVRKVRPAEKFPE